VPLRFFFLVDSFKVSNVDSTDMDVRREHFQYPKGFGMHGLIFTDILGNLLQLTMNIDGNKSDSTMYHSSPPNLQQRGIVIPIDTTGLGDSSFEGIASSVLPGAWGSLSTVPYEGMVGPQQIALAHMMQSLKRIIRQRVEMAIRVGKKGGCPYQTINREIFVSCLSNVHFSISTHCSYCVDKSPCQTPQY
jgi:hypothetical protein